MAIWAQCYSAYRVLVEGERTRSRLCEPGKLPREMPDVGENNILAVVSTDQRSQTAGRLDDREMYDRFLRESKRRGLIGVLYRINRKSANQMHVDADVSQEFFNPDYWPEF